MMLDLHQRVLHLHQMMPDLRQSQNQNQNQSQRPDRVTSALLPNQTQPTLKQKANLEEAGL